jgi:hypothetical protein
MVIITKSSHKDAAEVVTAAVLDGAGRVTAAVETTGSETMPNPEEVKTALGDDRGAVTVVEVVVSEVAASPGMPGVEGEYASSGADAEMM